jgi:hypothetical protein
MSLGLQVCGVELAKEEKTLVILREPRLAGASRRTYVSYRGNPHIVQPHENA